MSGTMPRGGRRVGTRSIHCPERSASAKRFLSAASHCVSKQPIWLGDAAQLCDALPPTIQRIAGSWRRRSASFTSSENRLKYNRDKLRYPSDLTDDEWSHIEPIIPPAKRGGRKRSVEPREIVNGLMYVLSTGCQWRYVPKDLPPKSTLFGYFDLWNWDGTLDRIHHALYVKCREAMDREASPTACVIDSQSVKSAEKGGATSIRAATMRARRSRKRHILVDTLGLLLHAVVHPADIQDRDGGVLVLSTLFGLYPFLQKL